MANNLYDNKEKIEELIGYQFDNWHLLQQAFVRKSFSMENGGENNEVLEFIGDKVLDLIVVQYLDDEYGSITDGDFREYQSELNEGKLTELKKNLVDKTMLAHRIDVLGLNEYLIMGKGDIKQNAQDQPSVKEDLFEAIIGAVAIDSKYDMNVLYDVVGEMLDPMMYIENGFDMDTINYVAKIQEWQQSYNGELPEYNYYNYYYDEYQCQVKISNPNTGRYSTFFGEGSNKSEARQNACLEAYNYLDENGYIEEDINYEEIVGEPDINRAVAQLNELSTKGYISQPEYSFEQNYDNDGNPIWECTCDIDINDYTYTRDGSTKREAKNSAAFAALNELFYGEDD